MRSAFFPKALASLMVGAFSWAAQAQFTFDHVGTGATGSLVTNDLPTGSYTLIGGGDDIWDTSDNFDFAHYTQAGDFDVRVRVESLEFTATWTKAGLMAREQLTQTSRMLFNRVTPDAGANDTRYAYRTGPGGAGGQHEDGSGNPGYPNAWLRLARSGASVEAFRSSDGISWASQGIQNTATWPEGALANSIELGLAVSRHSGADTLATAEFRNYGLSPVSIAGGPSDTLVSTGVTATFTVNVASGFANYVTYQWKENGADISGATSASYSKANALAGDSGKTYSVLVSNRLNGLTALSSNATLTTIVNPQVVSAGNRGNPIAIYVVFNQNMNTASAQTIGNYSIPGLTISSATLGADQRTVTLGTSAQAEDTTYVLTVQNVNNSDGNVLSPNPTLLNITPLSVGVTKNSIVMKRYYGIGGGLVSDLTSNPNFPNNPGDVSFRPMFEIPPDVADNYGAQVYGTFVAPVSGLYNFYISSDDESKLYLSSDATPANKVEIATEPQWAGQREFIYPSGDCCGRPGNYRTNNPTGHPVNIASNISLVAGERRYLEALVKEGGGGDNLAVAIEYPGSAAVVNGSLPITNAFFEPISRIKNGFTFTNYGPVLIVQGPTNTTVYEDNSVTFRVLVDGTPGYSFQWYSNSVAVTGATSQNYTFTAPASANGAQYHVVVANEFSSATSAVATLTVLSAPQLLSATTLGDPNGVYLTFSRTMGASALNPANYSIVSTIGTTPLLSPGDSVVGVAATPGSASSSISTVGTVGGANNYPGAETPAMAIDGNLGSKYLNFAEVNVGLIVTRAAGAGVARGVRFAAANDAPERDPVTISIEGTTATDATTAAGNATWTTIYSGPSGLATDPGRGTQGPVVGFANATPFNTYRILVTALRDGAAANSVQFSEVQLIDTNGSALNITGVTAWSGNQVRIGVATMALGGNYRVAVANVQDSGGSVIFPNPATANFVHGAGINAPAGLTMKRYDGSGDFNTIKNKIATCVPPQRENPNLPTMEYGTNPSINNTDPNTENYGAWVYGVFVAPTTGNYRFGFAADDLAELWIGTDARPASKVLVSSMPSWGAARDFVQPSAGNYVVPISQAIPMIAGQSYYMEALFQEGGGGDHVSVAVQLPGGPAIVDGTANVIPRSMFSTNYSFGCPPTAFFKTLGPVTVTGPGNQTVNEGSIATFTAIPDGTPPYGFQWYSNGVAVAGATSGTLSFRALRFDNGSQFTVVVTNPFSSVTSSVATLTVNTDSVGPVALRAYGSGTFSNATIEFNEPIDVGTGTEPSNYSITNSAGVVVNVLSVSIRDNTNLVLHTGQQTPGERYTIVMNNILDRSGVPNAIAANSTIAFSGWVWSSGFALMEVYPARSGNTVATLTGHPSYPNYPSERYYITSATSREAYPDDTHELYGGRISGHYVPAASGNTQFSIINDDDAEFRGSLSEFPADAQVVGSQVCCSGTYRNTGPAIPLTGGNRYYYEVLWKEGTGGDYGGLSDNGTTAVPGARLGVYANPDAVSLSITQQPMSQTRAENQVAALSVGTSVLNFDGAVRRLTYQWRSNGVDIAGANQATHITAPLSLANNGDVYSVLVRVAGAEVVSSNATIEVIVDVQGPVLLSATVGAGFNTINLRYNEPVAEGSAIEAGNYQIYDAGNNQIFVDSVTYGGSNVVVRTLTRLQDSSIYSLEIDFQTDLVGNPTDPVGMPTVDVDHGIATNVVTFVVSCGFARFEAYLGLTVPNNNNLTPLTNAINAGVPPSFSFYSNRVNWPQSSPDINNYGMRWTFWFIAPTAGTYKFEPSQDDGADIYAALDGNPANKVQVFHQDCCSGFGAGEAGYSVDLTAGQMIYLELLVIEAGGGDYAGLSVTLPDLTYIAPIPAAYIAQVVDPAVGATNGVGIAQQPQNRTITENSTASFTVVVTNAGQWGANFQWQVDTGSGFTDIPGASGSSYTTPPRSIADDGDLYRVKVYVLGKTIISSAATLNVITDTVKPLAIRARGVRQLNAVRVQFNEIMGPSAAEASNYEIRDSSNQVVPTTGPAVVSPDQLTITLPTGPLAAGATFSVSIANVSDFVGNTIEATNITFQNWTVGRGSLIFEAFPTGPGNSVAELVAHPSYPNSPDLISHIGSANSRIVYPGDGREGYGARMSGYFRPQLTVNHTFYISSDDASQLWLSTDASEANRVMLTEETGCCNPFSAHASGPRSLVAGNSYFMEMLYKEGTGGDYGQVAVKRSSDPRDPNSLPTIPGHLLWSLADPVGASITFTVQPESQTFPSGGTVFVRDFNADDGGFTVNTPQAYDGPWTYNAATGSWRQEGQGPDNARPNTSMLNSPVVNVTTAGRMSVSFMHRYSFEGGNWDGGQVRVSVNGGPFTAVPAAAFAANGYSGTVLANSSSVLAGQSAFVNASAGHGAGTLLTTTADLGEFNVGDTVQVQFIAASDTNTDGGSPDWEISAVQLTVGSALNVTLRSAVVTTNDYGDYNQIVYQWQKRSGTNWVDIQGANNANYAFAPAPGTVGEYRVMVFIPGASAASATATVVGLIVIDWAGAPQTLQEATNILGPWTDILMAPDPFVITNPTGAQRFFRQKP